MGVLTAAVIGSALIGAGSSFYMAEEQKKAQEDANRKTEEAARAAEAERLRIAQDTRPDGQSAQGIQYGADGDMDIGSTQDFLVEKKKTDTLGTSGMSGLGFAV